MLYDWHADISGTGSRSNIFSLVTCYHLYFSLIFKMWAQKPLPT